METATATGGLTGIEDVIGTPAADRITGSFATNLLRGEGGADILIGQGADILVGGDGNDKLEILPRHGLAGSVLIGGGGSDTVIGNDGQDLIVGGSTAFDADPSALRAILAEWRSPIPFATRVAHLNGTLPGGLNGTAFLTRSGPSPTVFDDAIDELVGYGDLDWILSSAGDLVTEDGDVTI
jgi:Ca2+-binding RTX toxin-like protein